MESETEKQRTRASSYAEAVNTTPPGLPGARANPRLSVRLAPGGNYTYYTFHHIYRIVAAISHTAHLIGNGIIYVSNYFSKQVLQMLSSEQLRALTNLPGVVCEATWGALGPGFPTPLHFQQLEAQPSALPTKRPRTQDNKQEGSPDTSEVILFSRTEIVYHVNTSKLYTYMTFFLLHFVDSNNQLSGNLGMGVGGGVPEAPKTNTRAEAMREALSERGQDQSSRGTEPRQINWRAEALRDSSSEKRRGHRRSGAMRHGSDQGKYKFMYFCNVYHEAFMWNLHCMNALFILAPVFAPGGKLYGYSDPKSVWKNRETGKTIQPSSAQGRREEEETSSTCPPEEEGN